MPIDPARLQHGVALMTALFNFDDDMTRAELGVQDLSEALSTSLRDWETLAPDAGETDLALRALVLALLDLRSREIGNEPRATLKQLGEWASRQE